MNVLISGSLKIFCDTATSAPILAFTKWQESVMPLSGARSLTPNSSDQLHSFVWLPACVAIWVCDLPCSILIKIDSYCWWTHTASHSYILLNGLSKAVLPEFSSLMSSSRSEANYPLPFVLYIHSAENHTFKRFMASNLIEDRTRGILPGFNFSSSSQHE